VTIKLISALVQDEATGTIYKSDGIEYDNKLWLVPSWLEVPGKRVSMPARIIRFDNLPHQSLRGSRYPADYLLNGPVPKALLGRETPREIVSGYEYVELPEIEVPESVRPLQKGSKPTGLN